MTRPIPVNIDQQCPDCEYNFNKTCLLHERCVTCPQHLKVSVQTIDAGLTHCKCNTVIDKSKCPYFEEIKI